MATADEVLTVYWGLDSLDSRSPIADDYPENSSVATCRSEIGHYGLVVFRRCTYKNWQKHKNTAFAGFPFYLAMQEI
jgi:hypothetical protein